MQHPPRRARLYLTALLTGFLISTTAHGGPPYGLSQDDADWLAQKTREQVAGCRVEGPGGVWLHTPDGSGAYRALWVRDFFYMVENAGGLIDGDELRASVEYLLDGQRADGCIPDRVNVEGKAIYSPGGPNNPLADHALDSGAFMALLACAHLEQHRDVRFFRSIEPRLLRGMDHTRRAENGLVWNDPTDPQCVYGFTDIVKKTGHLLMCSVIYHDACERMARACEASRCGAPDEYRRRAARIRESLGLLWNDQAGMFWAADGDCRQIDVWGSAFAVDRGVATDEQARRVAEYLAANYDGLVQRGQVRHLAPEDDKWERLFIERPAGEYQNGAYWATPLAWFVPVLARADEGLAAKTVRDVVADFRTSGVFECVNGSYTKVPHFVDSTTNVYGLLRE